MGDGAVIEGERKGGIAELYDFTLDDNFSGCPSFSYSLGMASAGEKTKEYIDRSHQGIVWKSKQNITVVYCYQQLEQVMTNVRFSYPAFTINSTAPPIPIEETAIVITKNNSQH